MRAERLAKSGEAVACAVIAAAAIEAFPADLLNYLLYAEKLTLYPELHSEIRKGLTTIESELARKLERVQNERKPLIHSIKAIYEAWGAKWDAKDTLAKDFALLTQVRNEIVHPKMGAITKQLLNGRTRGVPKGYPRVTARLVNKKLITPLDGSDNWLDALDNQSPIKESTQPDKKLTHFTNWIMLTSLRMIEKMLSAMPDTNLNSNEPSQPLAIITAFKHYARPHI